VGLLRPRLAEARGEGRRRPRRPRGHPDRVLLRLRLLPVRQELGRDLRAERALPDPGAAAAHLRPAVLPDCPTDSPPPGQGTPKPGKTPKP
jgi:hypothetical protein